MPGVTKVSNGSNSDWNILYWILGTVLMPVTFPLLIFNFMHKYRAYKQRDYLKDKVVLITGASSGLGEQLAHVFYKAGCKVILSARRVEELERVRNDLLALKKNFGNIYPPTILPLDVADLWKMTDFAADLIKIHDQIDIVINNAGLSTRCGVVETNVEIDLHVMMVNYFGSVALTKAVLPAMIKRGSGHICFISSVQGKFALPHRSAYCASKHAMQAFADSLRAEVDSSGVHVTCVSPGYIRTQLSMNAITSNGDNYGKMDETTQSGMPAEQAALRILDAVRNKENDVLICNMQAKVAYYIRVLMPPLYYWIMKRRADKLSKT